MANYEKQLNDILNDTIPSLNKRLGLNDAQKERLKEYEAHCNREGLGLRTRVEKMRVIAKFMAHSKQSLEKPDYDTVLTYIDHLSEYLSFGSMITRKGNIHSFLNWCYDDDIPKKINKLFKMKGQKFKDYQGRVKITPREILSEDDVLKLVDSAERIMTKALLCFMYGSAGRIGTILSMKMANINVDGKNIFWKYPTTENANKTGEGENDFFEYTWEPGKRYIFQWLKLHPAENEFLWLNRQFRKQEHSAFSVELKKICKRSGIEKKVTCHRFRHSRVSQLRRSDMRDYNIKKLCSWSSQSNTIEKYSHLDNGCVNEALRKADSNGRIKLSCFFCGEEIKENTEYCSQCGAKTDMDSIREHYEKEHQKIREEYGGQLQKIKEETQMLEELKAEERWRHKIRDIEPVMKENYEMKETVYHLKGEIKNLESGKAYNEMSMTVDHLQETLGKVLKALDKKGIDLEI